MLLTTVITQFKAFARDRQAIFWTLAFPLIFVTAFGLFDIGGDDVSVHTVAVVDYAGNDFSHGIVADLDALESFEVALRDDPAVARREIREGDLRYLMTIPADIAERVEAGRPAAVSFVFDETRSDAFAVLDRSSASSISRTSTWSTRRGPSSLPPKACARSTRTTGTTSTSCCPACSPWA